MKLPFAVRRGFTLVEMLTGMVVLAFIGMAMTSLLTSQMRFYEKQGAAGSARRVSRAAINRLTSDIRMVDADSGVVSAAANSIVLRVPYAIAVSCSRSVLSVLPVDSSMYAPGPGGYAWRGSTSIYTYVESGVTVTTSTATTCADSSVIVLTNDGGRQVAISPALPMTATAKGTIVFLTRRVQYQFKASTTVPGAYGLYRQQLTPLAAEEEIAAPFTSDSKFRFFVNNATTAQDAVPNPLGDLRGFELILNGQSEKTPTGEAAKKTENFTSAIFFKNRRS
jgi:prepilin-type N-terminal cleavage/methylation domain-containing protein